MLARFFRPLTRLRGSVTPVLLPDLFTRTPMRDTVFSPPSPSLSFGSRHSPFLQLDRLSSLQRSIDEQCFSSAAINRLGERALACSSPKFADAAHFFAHSAQSGNTDAHFSLGILHHAGFGVTQDPRRGAQHLKFAADRGHPRAKYCYGLCLLAGHGVRPDLSKGMAHLRTAAEAGYDEAMFVYGCSLLGGIGVHRDEKTAYAFFQKAAEKGHTPSILWEGVCLHDGLGVERDRSRAIHAFREASSRGLPEATEALRMAVEWDLGD